MEMNIIPYAQKCRIIQKCIRINGSDMRLEKQKGSEIGETKKN
jgi:hypothetical protein